VRVVCVVEGGGSRAEVGKRFGRLTGVCVCVRERGSAGERERERERVCVGERKCEATAESSHDPGASWCVRER